MPEAKVAVTLDTLTLRRVDREACGAWWCPSLRGTGPHARRSGTAGRSLHRPAAGARPPGPVW